MSALAGKGPTQLPGEPAAAPKPPSGLTGKDVLFIGIGQSAVAWYRCYLPAMAMGADWLGMVGQPPNHQFVTGGIRGSLNALDYKAVVVQQPRGRGWLGMIRKFQERGVKVLFEVDDYLHGIRKKEDFGEHAFGREELAALELNMRVCDGVICSTDYIARRYRQFNRHTAVCPNGLDLGRYRLTRPQRDTVNIGWAGASGHVKAAIQWLKHVPVVMRARDNTCFVSIGENFGDAMQPEFPTRSVSIPWTLLENYPGAMTMFDIALAPAGKESWYMGKSDLRWLEASALGIPTIADPTVYPNIEDGVTGFHAETPKEAEELMFELVDDRELREAVGANAKEYVLSNRSIHAVVSAWAEAITAVVD